MQQQVAVITLGVDNLARSRRFYEEGFGWQPGFQNEEIAFFQMNGLVLGLWLRHGLEQDAALSLPNGSGACALAHNVRSRDEVAPLMDRLKAAGGTITRPADAPPQGGFRGYVADTDGHLWEIAWNPDWPISPEGYVTMKA